MSDKHTPGPWEWDGNPCNYDHNEEAPWLWQAPWKAEESFQILSGSIKCGNKADARLIAAAPELLEALKKINGMCAAPPDFSDATIQEVAVS